MPYPDSATQNKDTRTWRVVGTSVAGTSHRKAHLPCQDAHLWKTLPRGLWVGAVSDGAGSAALAEKGAALAVQTAVETLAGSLSSSSPAGKAEWQDLFTAAFQTARTAVEQAAQLYLYDLRDWAATLILVVAGPDFAVAMQVGDGAAVVGDGNGDIASITSPYTGEYLNETTFLVSPNYLESAQFALWQGNVRHIALLSDGLQMLALKMPGGQPHGLFFAPLFDFLARSPDLAFAQAQLTQFLESPRIADRTDDDLTLLLATRGDHEITQAN